MKVTVYCSEVHNIHIFEAKNKDKFFEFKFVEEILTEETVELCKGYDGILINTLCILTEGVCQKLKEQGVKFIASRAAGTNHMDVQILNKYRLKTCNVPSYSPNAISELTVMLILNLLRNMKEVQDGITKYNFNTVNVCGRELRSMTVGLIGCGNIGIETIRILKGFEAKVNVLNCRLEKNVEQIIEIPRPEKEQVKKYANYMNLDGILKNSDIIICHMPFSDKTYHLIDKSFIDRCKNGVILINASRGGIFNAKDVLEKLESGKISGFGFDVYEDEERFVCKKTTAEVFNDGVIEKLYARNDVVFTPHIGYYTKEALRAMIEISLDNLIDMYTYDSCKNQIN